MAIAVVSSSSALPLKVEGILNEAAGRCLAQQSVLGSNPAQQAASKLLLNFLAAASKIRGWIFWAMGRFIGKEQHHELCTISQDKNKTVPQDQQPQSQTTTSTVVI